MGLETVRNIDANLACCAPVTKVLTSLQEAFGDAGYQQILVSVNS